MPTEDTPAGRGDDAQPAKTASKRRRGGLTRWLNRTLLPWLGPPPVGPFPVIPAAETELRQAQATCPLCGALMSLHEIDRSGERTQIYHPEPTE
ncbi:MAG: hypothetical protein R6W83_02035 [Cryobacterium sp.]